MTHMDDEAADRERRERAAWIAGYAAALEFCEEDEGRPFGEGGGSAEESAALAWARIHGASARLEDEGSGDET